MRRTLSARLPLYRIWKGNASGRSRGRPPLGPPLGMCSHAKMSPEARAQWEAECKAKVCAQCKRGGWAEKLHPQQTKCPSCQRQHKNGGPARQAKRQRAAGRKQAVLEQAVAQGAPPLVIHQGQQEHGLPPELDRELDDILRWCCDRSKGAQKVKGVDRIDGDFVELAVPAPHERQSRHAHLRKARDFDAWDAINKQGATNAWRGAAPTLALTYIQEMIDKTFAKMKVHFAGQQIIYHDFSIIMADLEQQTGSTRGQRVHVDVEMPGAFGIAFLKPGYATQVANYSVEEQWVRLDKFVQETGYSLHDVGMELGTTGTLLNKSYFGAYLLSQDDLLERMAQSTVNGSNYMTPGTIAILGGGMPHAAAGLTRVGLGVEVGLWLRLGGGVKPYQPLTLTPTLNQASCPDPLPNPPLVLTPLLTPPLQPLPCPGASEAHGAVRCG